jgi:cellobiose phosphorylase
MKTNYGHFNDANREYIITTPTTPTKWVNYVGSLKFGGLVDHTGGALLCAGDPALNRINKYIPQLPDTDFKGSTLYIRIKSADGYEILSPFFTPTLNELESYECRVGLSYQKITSVVAGIQVQVTIFVPNDSPLEIRDITVTNLRDDAVELDIIPVVEYSHFEALKQFTNADWVPQTMMSEEVKNGEFTTLLQYAFMRRDTQVNFLSANRPVDSFESDRQLFLGKRGTGTWANPAALQNDHFTNYEARRGDNIGALLIKLGAMAPQQSERTLVQFGQADRSEFAQAIRQFRDEKAVDQAFADLSAYWDRYLSKFQCQTPDPNFDAMVNIHNPRQCQTTFFWSRYLSLYQLGLGFRGLGFRDSSQDSMGVLASIPDEAKELQSKILSTQRADGSAMHQFFPGTMEANEGDSREEGDKQWYGDDHIWIILAVTAHLRETGDYSYLDDVIPFYDKTLPLEQREKGTVLDHLTRALAYTKAHVGQHGLPLLGFADWNDTVNLPGEAESLMIASLYGTALLEMIDLHDHLGNKEQADAYRADHAAMKKVVNEHGWDGEWFRRYYTQEGEPIGSKENTYGQIYTNGRTWPVIAGLADDDRASTALDSVDNKLNTKFGIKLSTPGYDGFDPELGGVSTYPPGAKENGGIFLHSNPWVMIANTKIGNGDRAFKYFNQINPAARNEDIDLFEVEPYCFPQNILGDEHPQFGLGRNSWLSGTSSWTYQASTQYILGIRPGHNGLVVTPCVPSSWNSYKVARQYRGAHYEIELTRQPEGTLAPGEIKITLNGTPIEGNTIPPTEKGSVNKVQILF